MAVLRAAHTIHHTLVRLTARMSPRSARARKRGSGRNGNGPPYSQLKTRLVFLNQHILYTPPCLCKWNKSCKNQYFLIFTMYGIPLLPILLCFLFSKPVAIHRSDFRIQWCVKTWVYRNLNCTRKLPNTARVSCHHLSLIPSGQENWLWAIAYPLPLHFNSVQ